VDSPARARKVIDLATGVPGVESVKSTLEINNRT
jgi:osmotically-inducible protein OsmY